MYHCSHYFDAKLLCERALGIDPNYWRALWCSTKASNQLYDRKEAATLLRKLLQDPLTRSESFSAKHGQNWKEMLKLAVDYCKDSKDIEQAIEDCQKLLAVAPNDYYAMETLINRMKAAGYFDKITAYLKKLHQTADMEDNNSLAALFYHCAESADFHHQIACAVRMESNKT